VKIRFGCGFCAAKFSGFARAELFLRKFNSTNFRFSVTRFKIFEEVREISASFKDKEIIVEIPLAAAQDWTESNLVTLENEQNIDEKQTLKILIEKDFACPDRPFDKDNHDAFALHPSSKDIIDESERQSASAAGCKAAKRTGGE